MSVDVSVLIPSIRTCNWAQVMGTLRLSCSRPFEVVFAGPFAPPEGFDMAGVKVVKTYACPSVAGQLGAEVCEGRLIYHAVDDARFLPGALDAALAMYDEKCGRRDVINMRYTEADDYSGKTFPPEYWYAHHHPQLCLPGVPKWFKIALHFLMDREWFAELGGFDCSWEYMNFNLHDLMFRVQRESGAVYDSPTDATNCNHYGNRAVDHGPIEDAYIDDHAKFVAKFGHAWGYPVRIPFDNWKQQPAVWPRRFSKKLYETYEEMLADR